jgi:propionyl-CoA carboxylase alpha chain
MYGANMPVLVQKPREFELARHMHVPAKQDFSDLVQSPMPGTVISFAVEVGDIVEIGQELCIIEAMKMQNIIRSPRSGVIESLSVKTGSSVSRDEIMIMLVPEEKPAEDDNVAA